MSNDYELHMLSFRAKGSNGFNVAFGDGKNLQPWHLDIVEEWLAEKRAQMAEARKLWDERIGGLPTDDGSDLV